MTALATAAALLTGKPAADDPPIPTAINADFDSAFLTNYAATAAVIGYAPPELELQRFRALCAEQGICCYDRAKVKAYLDTKYGGATKARPVPHNVWIEWAESPPPQTFPEHIESALRMMPRREREKARERLMFEMSSRRQRLMSPEMWMPEPRATWGWRPLDATPSGISRWSAPSDSDNLITSGNAYTKPIPMPVLRTAALIKEVAPSAKFFASDEIWEADVQPVRDPFLAVQVGGQFFIVERWDEPGFRP